MAGTYPSINDRDFDLLKKIATNTADLANTEAGDVSSIIAGTGISVSGATGNVTISSTVTGTLPTQTGNSGKLLTTDGTTASWTTTPVATSVTGPTTTPLTLTGGSSGASLVLGQGANGAITATLPGTGLATVVGTITAIGASGVEGGVLRVRNNTTSVTTAPVFVLGINRQNSAIGALYLGNDGSNNGVISTGNGNMRFGNETAGSFAEYARFAVNTGNLLIGTTTDAANLAGGLVINGSGSGAAASGPGTGALRVTGGSYVSGAGYFGGAVTAGGLISTSGTFASARAFSATTPSGNGVGIRLLQTSVSDWEMTNTATTGALTFANSTTSYFTLSSTGAATFAGAVTIAGTVIHTLSATPASATAAGTVGTMSWDTNYIYICTATNTWKRVAIATW